MGDLALIVVVIVIVLLPILRLLQHLLKSRIVLKLVELKMHIKQRIRVIAVVPDQVKISLPLAPPQIPIQMVKLALVNLMIPYKRTITAI